MKTIHRLALAALLPLGACADAAPTETAAAPAGPSAVMGPSPACITFGPPPPAWTVWGAPALQAPGTVVHTEASIPVTVEQFNNGGLVYNQARIEPASSIGWGTANSLHMMDIATRYHFMAPGGWLPNQVRFRYQDLGGIENLAINGALYVGDISTAPATLGGTTVTVFPGGVNIVGPVRDLLIGGRDFRVDDVCAIP